MRSHPSTLAQKALLVLLSTTACLQAAADPSSPPQAHLAPPEDDPIPIPAEEFDNMEDGQMPMEDEYDDLQDDDYPADDAEVEAAASIQYGQCYYFTNPEGEHLGSNGNVYSWLKFGSNNYRRPFKLCKDRHDCSRGGPLHHRGSFYLLDFQGSKRASGRNIIAGHLRIFPSFRPYTNYLHFRAYNDCDIGHNADCYTRLGLTDQKRNRNGLEVNRHNEVVLSRNEQHTIAVKFNRIQCQDYFDLDSEL